MELLLKNFQEENSRHSRSKKICNIFWNKVTGEKLEEIRGLIAGEILGIVLGKISGTSGDYCKNFEKNEWIPEEILGEAS